MKRIIAFIISFCLIFEQTGFAQVAVQLGIPGYAQGSSSPEKFRPAHLRYLSYDTLKNNFRMLLDKGDEKSAKEDELKISARELFRYFLIGLTLPNDSFWVNLRPDSPDDVIDPDLAKTDIGRVFLEADVQLKKDTARYTSPGTTEGKQYWARIYQKANELFASENIDIPTLTRPWIVPNEIILGGAGGSVYIYKASLKVMLESDYLKNSATYSFQDERLKILNEYSAGLIRELIIPKLTKDVNTSPKYAGLRQVYYSLILAQWFKKRSKDNIGTSRIIDQKDLTGLVSAESWSKDTYFRQYQESFRKGEYNLQEYNQTPYGQTVRQYFSGGIDLQAEQPLVTYKESFDPFYLVNTEVFNAGISLDRFDPTLETIKIERGNVKVESGVLQNDGREVQKDDGLAGQYSGNNPQIYADMKAQKASRKNIKGIIELETKLQDGDQWVRAAAAQALGLVYAEMVKHGRQPDLPALEIRLEDKYGTVRIKAGQALGLVYAEMVRQDRLPLAVLETSFEHADSVLYTPVAQAIGQIYAEMVEAGQLSVSGLETGLRDKDWKVRAAAAQALGLAYAKMVKQGGQPDLSALEARLKDEDVYFGQSLVQGLSQVYAEQVRQSQLPVAVLETRLQDKNSLVRAAAVRALGLIYAEMVKQGGQPDLSSLKAGLKDGYGWVSFLAGQGLSQVYAEQVRQGKLSLSVLEEGLKDENIEVASVAQALALLYAERLNQDKILDGDYIKYELWRKEKLLYRDDITDEYFNSVDPQAYLISLKQQAEQVINKGFDYNNANELFFVFFVLKSNGVKMDFGQFHKRLDELREFDQAYAGYFKSLFSRKQGVGIKGKDNYRRRTQEVLDVFKGKTAIEYFCDEVNDRKYASTFELESKVLLDSLGKIYPEFTDQDGFLEALVRFLKSNHYSVDRSERIAAAKNFVVELNKNKIVLFVLESDNPFALELYKIALRSVLEVLVLEDEYLGEYSVYERQIRKIKNASFTEDVETMNSNFGLNKRYIKAIIDSGGSNTSLLLESFLHEFGHNDVEDLYPFGIVRVYHDTRGGGQQIKYLARTAEFLADKFALDQSAKLGLSVEAFLGWNKKIETYRGFDWEYTHQFPRYLQYLLYEKGKLQDFSYEDLRERYLKIFSDDITSWSQWKPINEYYDFLNKYAEWDKDKQEKHSGEFAEKKSAYLKAAEEIQVLKIPKNMLWDILVDLGLFHQAERKDVLAGFKGWQDTIKSISVPESGGGEAQNDGGYKTIASPAELIGYIKEFAGKAGGPNKLKVWLDIDNTVFDHKFDPEGDVFYPTQEFVPDRIKMLRSFMSEKEFADSKTNIADEITQECVFWEKRWFASGLLKPVKGIPELLRFAKENGVEVNLITNRPADPGLREVTINILNSLNIRRGAQYSNIIFVGAGNGKAERIKENIKDAQRALFVDNDERSARSIGEQLIGLPATAFHLDRASQEGKFSYDYFISKAKELPLSDLTISTDKAKAELYLGCAALEIAKLPEKEQAIKIREIKNLIQGKRLNRPGSIDIKYIDICLNDIDKGIKTSRQDGGTLVFESDPAKRLDQISGLLKEIDKELSQPGTGNLPLAAVISDYHGDAKRLAELMSSALNKLSGFEGKLDPAVPIEQQMNSQGLSLKTMKGAIYFNGDLLDRGPEGIKCFLMVKELVEVAPDRVQYNSGNHDLWAFLNLMGFHLPWYEGYNFYENTGEDTAVAKEAAAAAMAVKLHSITEPRFFNSVSALNYWTKRLAEYNKLQAEFHKKFFLVNPEEENPEKQISKAKETRERFNGYYEKYGKGWNKDQVHTWEFFVGNFATLDVPDPEVGLNGIGKTSAGWWQDIHKELMKGREARSNTGADAEELAAWDEAVKQAGVIAKAVQERLDTAVKKGDWMYLVLESINSKAYESVEWWGKDWSSHKGWGEAVIKEIENMTKAGFLKGEPEKIGQDNYIQSPTLQALADFYRKNFNLYLKDAYGNVVTHGWLPVADDGSITITYKGKNYTGKEVFGGLDAISKDVKDTNKPLKEVWEGLNIVNSWYADATTTLKPKNVKNYREKIGIAKIQSNLGVRNWLTGHNPLNKLKTSFMNVQDGYAHFEIDKGMADKFGHEGAYALIGPDGIKAYGFEAKASKEIVEAPKTVIAGKEGKADTVFENKGKDGREFLTAAKKDLEEEFKKSFEQFKPDFRDMDTIDRVLQAVKEIGGALNGIGNKGPVNENGSAGKKDGGFAPGMRDPGKYTIHLKNVVTGKEFELRRVDPEYESFSVWVDNTELDSLFEFDEDSASITVHSMGVPNEYTAQGIGLTVLKYLAERAKAKGKSLVLHNVVSYAVARMCYEHISNNALYRINKTDWKSFEAIDWLEKFGPVVIGINDKHFLKYRKTPGTGAFEYIPSDNEDIEQREIEDELARSISVRLQGGKVFAEWNHSSGKTPLACQVFLTEMIPEVRIKGDDIMPVGMKAKGNTEGRDGGQKADKFNLKTYFSYIQEARDRGDIIEPAVPKDPDLMAPESFGLAYVNTRFLFPDGKDILEEVVMNGKTDLSALVIGPGTGRECWDINALARKRNKKIRVDTVGLTALPDRLRLKRNRIEIKHLLIDFVEQNPGRILEGLEDFLDGNAAAIQDIREGINSKDGAVPLKLALDLQNQGEGYEIYAVLDKPYINKQYIGNLNSLTLEGTYDFIYDNRGGFFYSVKNEGLSRTLAQVLPLLSPDGIFYCDFLDRKFWRSGQGDIMPPGFIIVTFKQESHVVAMRKDSANFKRVEEYLSGQEKLTEGVYRLNDFKSFLRELKGPARILPAKSPVDISAPARDGGMVQKILAKNLASLVVGSVGVSGAVIDAKKAWGIFLKVDNGKAGGLSREFARQIALVDPVSAEIGPELRRESEEHNILEIIGQLDGEGSMAKDTDFLIFVNKQGVVQGKMRMRVSNPGKGTLIILWVIPELQNAGNGIGTMLLDVFFRILRDQNIKEALIPSAADAAGFYKKYLKGKEVAARDYKIDKRTIVDNGVAFWIPRTTIQKIASSAERKDGGEVKDAIERWLQDRGLARFRIKLFKGGKEANVNEEKELFIKEFDRIYAQVPVTFNGIYAPRGNMDVFYMFLREIAENSFDAVSSFYDPALKLLPADTDEKNMAIDLELIKIDDNDVLKIIVSDNGAGSRSAGTDDKIKAHKRGDKRYFGRKGLAEDINRSFILGRWKGTGLKVNKLGKCYERKTEELGSVTTAFIPLQFFQLKSVAEEQTFLKDGGVVSLSIPLFAYNTATPEKLKSFVEEMAQDRKEFAAAGNNVLAGYQRIVRGIEESAGFEEAPLHSIGNTLISFAGGIDIFLFGLNRQANGVNDLIIIDNRPFGGIQDIYRPNHAPVLQRYYKIGSDSGEALDKARVAGNIALERIMAGLNGEIKGVYYFVINPDGTLAFLEEKQLSAGVPSSNAVIEFVDPENKTGAKRFWYIQQDINADTPGFSNFISGLNFDTLVIKAGFDLFSKDSGLFDRQKAIEKIVAPARRNNALVITDSDENSRVRYSMWALNPKALALNGIKFGLSDQVLHFGRAERLIFVDANEEKDGGEGIEANKSDIESALLSGELKKASWVKAHSFIEQIVSSGRSDEEIVKEMNVCLSYPENVYIRAWAAVALGRIKNEQSVELLIAHLKTEDQEAKDTNGGQESFQVIAAIVGALAMLGDPRAIKPLEELLQHHPNCSPAEMAIAKILLKNAAVNEVNAPFDNDKYAQRDGGDKGGIDLRSLPIVSHPGSVLSAGVNSRLVDMDMEGEWKHIRNMVNSGFIPNMERLRDYAAACCQKGIIDRQKENILLCAAEILRIEEDKNLDTDPGMKALLVSIDQVS